MFASDDIIVQKSTSVFYANDDKYNKYDFSWKASISGGLINTKYIIYIKLYFFSLFAFCMYIYYIV